MSNAGFEPKSIIIRPGTKVIFENVSNVAKWPASDDHPSHTLYDGTSKDEHCTPGATPAFDACGNIAPTESWEFTFPTPGIYKMHDHLDSQYEGRIIVREYIFQNLIKYVKAIFSNNTSVDDHSAEYLLSKQKYEDIVKDQDPGIAIQTLRIDSEADDNINSLCHDFLHVIGRTAYDKYRDFNKAVIYHQDFCNSGYIHGLFESYFRSNKDPFKNLAKMCEYSTDVRAFDRWQCQHGIGHGLMYYTAGDVGESLYICESALSEEATIDCRNGVVMELWNSELLAKEPDFINKNNPLKTCENMSIAKTECYVYVPVYMHQTLHMDFKSILEVCADIDNNYRSVCAQGVGSESLKRNMYDLDSVVSACSYADNASDESSCLFGAASMYVNQKASYEAGLEFCALIPKTYQEECQNIMSEKAYLFE